MIKAAGFSAGITPSQRGAKTSHHLKNRSPLAITELRRDSGCCRSLNWRCDLEPHLDVTRAEARFIARGYISRCRHTALRVLRHPEGHELAWVVTTGRMQLRVDLAVDERSRESTARRFYQEVVEILVGSQDSEST